MLLTIENRERIAVGDGEDTPAQFFGRSKGGQE